MTSSPAVGDHPEEPFCSWRWGSGTAAGEGGQMCIRNSWGKSRRNTWRKDLVAGFS